MTGPRWFMFWVYVLPQYTRFKRLSVRGLEVHSYESTCESYRSSDIEFDTRSVALPLSED